MPPLSGSSMSAWTDATKDKLAQQVAEMSVNEKVPAHAGGKEQIQDGFTVIKTKHLAKLERKFATATSELQVGSLPNLSRGETLNTKNISKAQEKDLHDGPTVRVFVGGKLAHGKVPKRCLMAVSESATAFFNANPAAKEVRFSADSANSKVVANILYRLVDSPISGFKLPMALTFTKAVLTYQAAQALGMGKYAEPISKGLRVTISQRLLDYEEIDVVLAALPATDRSFQTLANDLSFRRHKGMIPDADDFDAYLANNAKLADAIAEIEAEHQAVREARHEQRVRAADRRHRLQEKREVAAIKQTINATGSVKTTTSEQAEVQRKLMGRGN
ncbi:hypothetical protein P154DRAFT_539344 [Amniculicola lignicola CBS 123094]|uniref:BTB domain-containing protein n=1 Tax=Amniculicola lignicola CBS 123094 TaxID=1392246 RepID=A0A6A5VYP9_9PLEO|nr:hypothetical protein P154DRAFT_539344 [Amniculicola lignicola CBS 123094]